MTGLLSVRLADPCDWPAAEAMLRAGFGDEDWFLHAFFDFVYEVVREKLILGVDELTDSDIRVFFKDKQTQSEKIAALQDYTLHRLGSAYKTQLYEAGILDDNKGNVRKILRPILDVALERWLQNNGYAVMISALTGVK